MGLQRVRQGLATEQQEQQELFVCTWKVTVGRKLPAEYETHLLIVCVCVGGGRDKAFKLYNVKKLFESNTGTHTCISSRVHTQRFKISQQSSVNYVSIDNYTN